ncbi:hypothetical protein [Streptomyces sp. NPDC001970]
MNKLMRRMATSTASLALAGIALVGAAGSASAESLPTAQERRDAGTLITTRDGGRDVRDGKRYDRNSERRDWDGRWRWDGEKDGRGYWYSHDRHHHHRYDGQRFARWIDGKWVIVLTDRRHDFDDGYFDQAR